MRFSFRYYGILRWKKKKDWRFRYRFMKNWCWVSPCWYHLFGSTLLIWNFSILFAVIILSSLFWLVVNKIVVYLAERNLFYSLKATLGFELVLQMAVLLSPVFFGFCILWWLFTWQRLECIFSMFWHTRFLNCWFTLLKVWNRSLINHWFRLREETCYFWVPSDI